MSSTYSTVQCDMWDLISYRVYGTEKHVKNCWKRIRNIGMSSSSRRADTHLPGYPVQRIVYFASVEAVI